MAGEEMMKKSCECIDNLEVETLLSAVNLAITSTEQFMKDMDTKYAKEPKINQPGGYVGWIKRAKEDLVKYQSLRSNLESLKRGG
jgi:hypothetical protein